MTHWVQFFLGHVLRHFCLFIIYGQMAVDKYEPSMTHSVGLFYDQLNQLFYSWYFGWILFAVNVITANMCIYVLTANMCIYLLTASMRIYVLTPSMCIYVFKCTMQMYFVFIN